MATADQVKALIRSHAEGDDTRFYAIALQVAAQAVRSGHGKFALELRELVDQVKARSKAITPATNPKPVPLAQPRGELAGLLTVGYTKTRVSDMALTDALRARLDRVITEHRERDRLRQHGFSPMRKLLLVGPPGTGKTMTAAAIGLFDSGKTNRRPAGPGGRERGTVMHALAGYSCFLERDALSLDVGEAFATASSQRWILGRLRRALERAPPLADGTQAGPR